MGHSELETADDLWGPYDSQIVIAIAGAPT